MFLYKNIIEQYSPFRFRTGCCTVHGGGTFVWATAKRKRTRPLDSHRLKWKEKEFLRCQVIPYFFKCFRRSLVEGGGACERAARRRTVDMLGAHPNSGGGSKQHTHNGNQQDKWWMIQKKDVLRGRTGPEERGGEVFTMCGRYSAQLNAIPQWLAWLRSLLGCECFRSDGIFV